MGKIKNRDQKRTKARIFSTGACNNKGPAQPDKRDAEYPCTHCDRIFKQSGRLKEHLLKHHPEANSTTCSSLVAEDAKQEQGISVQDVGSSHGYYTHKSPKLLLSEWCQKKSRRRPIYKITTAEFGPVQCKVVLPDMKDARKDLVLSLDTQFTSDATEAELQQRGAAAALCHVAGDCAYHRTLPPEYLNVWNHYKDVYDREQKEAVRNETLPMVKPEQRELQAIVMSPSKQEFLEATLRQRYPALKYPMDFRVPSELQSLERRLRREGFPQQRILQALHHTVQTRAKSVIPSVLDWLCFNLSDAELPKAYKKRSKTQMVGVIKTVAEAFEKEDAEEMIDLDEIDDPNVDALIQYGYGLPSVIHVLESTDSDLLLAHRMLFMQLTGVTLVEASEVGDEENQWRDECDVLGTIYGDRCRIYEPANGFELLIDIPEELVGNDSSQIWRSTASKKETTFLFSVGEIGADYPMSIPLIAVSCSGMKYQFLRYLTIKLAEKTTDMLGIPFAHALIDALMDLLHEAAQSDFSLTTAEDPIDVVDENAEEISDEPDAEEDFTPVVVEPKQRKKLSPSALQRWTPAEIQAENEALLQHQQKQNRCPFDPPAFRARLELPAASFAEHITEQIHLHDVTVITGMPGCGKSTQVPQFLLDAYIIKGLGCDCNIVCTQPRRISAISLATRVAEERDETVGDVIGYSIRNQHKSSKRTRILYCTTGILLRKFASDPLLEDVSHVIVDEVHERSVETDLLLLALKKLLEKSKKTNSKILCPKIILMSATANAEDFQNYFANLTAEVPIVNIPGFTYPVREFYLEDVGVALRGETPSRPRNGWIDDPSGNKTCSYSEQPTSKKKSKDPFEIDYETVERLVGYVIRNENDRGCDFLIRNWPGVDEGTKGEIRENGAILVFLPGVAEIDRMVKMLRTTSAIPSFKKVAVLPLHASLPPSDQRRVFDDFGPDVRKIIVATNVAETSVTISDVTIVIDTCLAKEIRYDVERRISLLKVQWISKASAKQRAGRAGRVQCGVCFRLVSVDHWNRLRDETMPEITRTPLQSFCLTALSLLGRGSPLPKLLQQCITPPSPAQIDGALTSLKNVGAVDHKQQLTPLGFHLMKMPMDVHLGTASLLSEYSMDVSVGKMLIYGSLLRCVDSVLTLTAALAHGRSLFVCPRENRELANQARAQLYEPYQNAKSDHMAIVAAVQAFRQSNLKSSSPYLCWAMSHQVLVRSLEGSAKANEFCHEHFLSPETLFAILDGRIEYVRILADLGFVTQSYVKHISNGISPDLDPCYDAFSSNSRFVRAAICAGFYPNLIRVHHPPKRYVTTQGGSKEVDPEAKLVKLFEREKGRVFLHASSVNFKVGQFESGWLVYSDIIETDKVFVRQCSMVPVYSMLLFTGGHVHLQHQEGVLTLPVWRARFHVHPKIGVMIKMLRREIENILALRIEQPDAHSTENSILTAVMALLETDGF